MNRDPLVSRKCQYCGSIFLTADPQHDHHCSRECVVKEFQLGEYNEDGSSYKCEARKSHGGEMRYVYGEEARVQTTLQHHGGFHGRDDQ